MTDEDTKKDIELRSAALDPANVIVDAERRCICVSNGTTTYHNILNSITFQNGYSSFGEKLAGGIFSLSKTLVTNCVVRRCYHETSSENAYGGGVGLIGVDNVRIEDWAPPGLHLILR